MKLEIGDQLKGLRSFVEQPWSWRMGFKKAESVGAWGGNCFQELVCLGSQPQASCVSRPLQPNCSKAGEAVSLV